MEMMKIAQVCKIISNGTSVVARILNVAGRHWINKKSKRICFTAVISGVQSAG
jgi:hypothetical protein